MLFPLAPSSPDPAPPPSFPALLSAIAEESSPKKNKKKKKSKRKNEHVSKLRDQLRQETERFLQLAENDATAIESELQRLSQLNLELANRVSDNTNLTGKQLEDATPPPPESPSAVRQFGPGPLKSHQRWITPKESGYESDSTTADDEGPSISYSEPPMLKGRAQTRVLLETRNALSRAAMCQVFTDPALPGAVERRDALLRALTTLANMV